MARKGSWDESAVPQGWWGDSAVPGGWFALDLIEAGQSGTPVGMSTETDTASSLARLKTKTFSHSTESDTALSLTRVRIRPVGLAQETGSAFGLARVKVKSAQTSAETGAALQLGRVKSKALGLSPETDTSISLERLKLLAIGMSGETSTAFELTQTSDIILPAGLATETSQAFALPSTHIRDVGMSTETSEAQWLQARWVVMKLNDVELPIHVTIGAEWGGPVFDPNGVAPLVQQVQSGGGGPDPWGPVADGFMPPRVRKWLEDRYKPAATAESQPVDGPVDRPGSTDQMAGEAKLGPSSDPARIEPLLDEVGVALKAALDEINKSRQETARARVSEKRWRAAALTVASLTDD